MSQKPSLPKGTRDFSPIEMHRRNYIFETLRNVFIKYGFEPIETPAFENISTLTGKYGDEGDQLLFKILNSRPHEANEEKKLQMQNVFNKTLDRNTNSPELTEKALRYDLTVPFARYVVQHQNEIVFPFKRYQIQPVWRADKPQKGRYREFYQCDVDVIGSKSLLNELELIQIVDDVFKLFGIGVTIHLNNRKILSGIAEIIGEKDKIIEITIAIDKIDKIGIDNVNKELVDKGLSKNAIDKLQPILNLSGDNNAKIVKLTKLLQSSEVGIKGIDEINTIFKFIENFSFNNIIKLDLTLARGLNYYTGAIFEVKANEIDFGSVCGGGRYDDLTGIFGLKEMSGVGISFGADRIYDVLLHLNAFPNDAISQSKVMFVNFGKIEEEYCLKLLNSIRNAGINAEIYPDATKIKKQMNYGNNKKIPFIALVGEEEIRSNLITLKDMNSGGQEKIGLEELILKFSK